MARTPKSQKPNVQTDRPNPSVPIRRRRSPTRRRLRSFYERPCMAIVIVIELLLVAAQERKSGDMSSSFIFEFVDQEDQNKELRTDDSTTWTQF